MTVLWRISNHCSLTGLGGQTNSGRWHTAEFGKRIVYLSEHPALALIETLVNIRGRSSRLPDVYQLLKIVVPDSLVAEMVDRNALAPGWESDRTSTQPLGDAWLGSSASALLGVPAAPSPESTNYLLNPRHLDARRVEIDWCRRITYDNRLFGVREKR